MKALKISGIWILGLIIIFSAAKYQRATGPTYPYRTSLEINDTKYDLELVRSGFTSHDETIFLPITDEAVTATISYKRYPTSEPFVTDTFKIQGDRMIAYLPKQPMAGKLEYFVELKTADEHVLIPNQIIRFKGNVPTYILAPHILFMFLTMLLSNVAGLFAVFNFGRFKTVANVTLLTLFIGGLVLGPIVQKYAFNEYWAGVPFGWDLTDNKTLIAFIFWGVAYLINRKKPSRLWTIAASIVTLIIFAIPHSMHGSELNPETGEIIQGTFFLLLAGKALVIRESKMKRLN